MRFVVGALLAALALVGLVAAAACSSGGAPPSSARPDDASLGAEAGNDVAAGDAGGCDAATSPESGVSLPTPSGRYGIARGGRRTLVDVTRAADPTTPTTDAGTDAGAPVDGGARALSVEVWYPTNPCEPGTPAPYLDDAEGVVIAFDDPEYYRRVKTHAVKNAPFTTDGGKRPLLLFSPGYGVLPRAYSAVIESVVSHGYVVAAISHTFWTPITIFADGSSALATHGGATSQTFEDELSVWLGDARFVLDEMEKVAASDPLGEVQGRLDLGRIGMYGHSFGGATAINLIAVDPRASAAVDLDGTIGGSPLQGTTRIAMPFLLFSSDRPPDATFTYVFSGATGPAYSLTLAKSGHGSFTDFAPMLAQTGRPVDPGTFGTIDPMRALAVINAYDIAFFDKHLASQDAPLLAGASPAYPEITTFQKRP